MEKHNNKQLSLNFEKDEISHFSGRKSNVVYFNQAYHKNSNHKEISRALDRLVGHAKELNW